MTIEEKKANLRQELDRLSAMYQQAKRDQLGITLGLLDIQAEVYKIYKELGLVPPAEVLEAFRS